MRAAVFQSEGVLAIEDRPRPELRSPTDVLVRVLACGICGTDLHILHVPQNHPCTPGTILGHEFIGDIAEVGADVTTAAVGDRVAVRPILTCGSCRECLLGRPNHCANMDIYGVFRDGGLAEFAVVPASACITMSAQTPIEIAALAEPLACVYNASRKAQLFPGDDVVIFGAGAIGLLFLAIFKEAGARRIVVVEPTAMRSRVAHQMGAETVDPAAVDPAAAIEVLVPGGPQVAVDAVGTQLGNAVAVAGIGARVILFGQSELADTVVHQADVTKKELTIIGSFVGQLVFPAAVALIESGRLNLAPIVSHTGSIDDLPRLIAESREGRVVKAVILPGKVEA
ncbi:MAG: alcohol dehydrogenase catalytic domain-containing protein [Candidatus Limnocylindrales bacterium]